MVEHLNLYPSLRMVSGQDRIEMPLLTSHPQVHSPFLFKDQVYHLHLRRTLSLSLQQAILQIYSQLHQQPTLNNPRNPF